MKKQFNLVGIDGNIFSIIGYTTNAMRESGFSYEERKSFSDLVTKSKNYDEALGLCIEKVDECNNRHKNNNLKTESFELKEEYDAWESDEKLDKEIENWFKQYVPNTGAAPSIGGEILRAFSRIAYRWYNDGDYAGFDYGLETAGSACSYLYSVLNFEFSRYIINLIDIRPEEGNEKKYTNALISLEKEIVDYLNSHPEVFNKDNDDDYQSYPEYYDGEDSDEYEERRYYSDDEHWEEEDDWEDEYDDEENDEDDDW